MTAKILTKSGFIVHRSTHWALSQLDWENEALTEQRKAFEQKIQEKLGPAATEADIPQDSETPEYDLYEDDAGEAHEHAPDDDVTPDTGADHYS